MKEITVVQGTRKWLEARCGIPTASEFDNILTPGGKPSQSFDRYLRELLAEKIMGHPRATAVTLWMQRGTVMEKQARKYYEAVMGVTVRQVGFIVNDEGTVGASPDGMVDVLCEECVGGGRGAEGLVPCNICLGTGYDMARSGMTEFKAPSEHVHVGYLLASRGSGVDKTYKPQTQGQLWITSRAWVDIVSFHPDMPEVMFRIERDEQYITNLSKAVMEFSRVLELMTQQLIEDGLIEFKPVVELPNEQLIDPDECGVTREDAEVILRKHFGPMYKEATGETPRNNGNASE